MLSDFLKKNITSQAKFVTYGYGQVEPNHLSAQQTEQVYAQLPAAADIDVLEQGQFVKYDYAKGLVDFTGEGEWMLVFNEIKLYRDGQDDCEFAMLKDNYQARVYSPFGYALDKNGNPAVDDMWDRQSRYYNGVDADGNSSMTLDKTFTLVDGQTKIEIAGRVYDVTDGSFEYEGTTYTADSTTKKVTVPVKYSFDDVTAAPDMYEIHYNEDPYHILGPTKEALMPAGTTMVPRVFKTNIGDIFTTNTIDEDSLAVGDIVAPRTADGILCKAGETDKMKWQVVKVYTMPDHQKGVKLMRIA